MVGLIRTQELHYAALMRVASGKVVCGKVVFEGKPLPDGATVAVVVLDNSEIFELEPSDEAVLLAAIEEIRTGDTVGVEDIFEQIRPIGYALERYQEFVGHRDARTMMTYNGLLNRGCRGRWSFLPSLTHLGRRDL